MSKTEQEKQGPNEIKNELDQFTGTTHYFRHFTGLKYTDGMKYLADKTGCHWFIDVIASYQCDVDAPFQIWKVKVNEDKSALITMREDTKSPVIVS